MDITNPSLTVCSRKVEKEREFWAIVEDRKQRGKCGGEVTVTLFWWGSQKSIFSFEDSQAMPFRPSGKGTVEMKPLR
jgi:hypothetical protein